MSLFVTQDWEIREARPLSGREAEREVDQLPTVKRFSHSTRLRFWLYAHLASAVFLTFFSLADRSLLPAKWMSWIVLDVFGVLIVPCILLMYLAPVIVFCYAVSGRYGALKTLLILAMELLVTWGNIFAMLPAVS